MDRRPATEVVVDDDDDEDVDLSAYDVGDCSVVSERTEPTLARETPPPAAVEMPRVGASVMAVYGRRWQPARVVDVDADTRVLRVTFPGYGDVVTLPPDRWAVLDTGGRRQPAAAELNTANARRSDGERTGRAAAKREFEHVSADEELSAEERAMLQRCKTVHGAAPSTARADAAILLPGAPLDEGNRGHRLLRLMGWRDGEGLGAQNEGRVKPLAEDLPVQQSRAGLGATRGGASASRPADTTRSGGGGGSTPRHQQW